MESKPVAVLCAIPGNWAEKSPHPLELHSSIKFEVYGNPGITSTRYRLEKTKTSAVDSWNVA
jgi:hypothetical protein